MNCKQILEQMPAYLDGDLPDADMESLELHFEECSECRLELDKLERTWSLLDAWEPVEPSPVFRAMVWEKIRKQPVQLQGFRAKLLRNVRLGMSSLAAACLVIGFSFTAAMSDQAVGDNGPHVPQAASLRSMEAAENLASDLPLGQVDLFEDPSAYEQEKDPAQADQQPTAADAEAMSVGHMSHHWLENVHDALQATLEDS